MPKKIRPYPVKNHGDNIQEDTIINAPNIIIKDVKKFYKGWKQFAFKDNVIHIAIGMIMASSFQKLVGSMVVDIIMPILIGIGVGTQSENLFAVLSHGKTENVTYITPKQAKEDGAVTLNYGIFINTFVNLLFVSFCLYLVLQIISFIKKKAEKKEISELL
jgi:large conductance mechanosensitive channel